MTVSGRNDYVDYIIRITDHCSVHAAAAGEQVTVENFNDDACTCKWSPLVAPIIQSQNYVQDFGSSVCPQVATANNPSAEKTEAKKDKASKVAKATKLGGGPPPAGGAADIMTATTAKHTTDAMRAITAFNAQFPNPSQKPYCLSFCSVKGSIYNHKALPADKLALVLEFKAFAVGSMGGIKGGATPQNWKQEKLDREYQALAVLCGGSPPVGAIPVHDDPSAGLSQAAKDAAAAHTTIPGKSVPNWALEVDLGSSSGLCPIKPLGALSDPEGHLISGLDGKKQVFMPGGNVVNAAPLTVGHFDVRWGKGRLCVWQHPTNAPSTRIAVSSECKLRWPLCAIAKYNGRLRAQRSVAEGGALRAVWLRGGLARAGGC